MIESLHGSPFEAPQVEEVKKLFPSYEVLGLIACGGMGAVYHGIQTSLDRPVAIKILPREFSQDAEFRAGFESEAKAMAKLNHPNLIGVYDFGEAGGMLFIVMEFVAGKSLHNATHGCAVEQADALAIVIGVCHGLAHAHEYGILHRDIKPSNILLDTQNNPKIGDFGLARALEREIQEGEQIFGTPGYTAPEVLQPPFTIDQRADIFSVGVMLHEMLTGHLPDADPRPTSQIIGCNFRIDAVIQRATQADPTKRYTSVMELARELVVIAALPTRTIRTNLTLAKVTSKVRTPGGSGSQTALSRPAGAGSPQSAFNPPKAVVKDSSGSGLAISLVIALVVVIIFFLMHGNKRSPTTLTSPPTAAPVGEPPVPVSSEPGADAKASPDEALRRVRSSVRQRASSAVEIQRRDMRTSLSDYESALQAAAEDLPFAEKERAQTAISDNLRALQNNGNRISESLPLALGVIDGAQEIHSRHVEKQTAIVRKFDSDMSSLAGLYLLDLQNQIGQLEKDDNSQAANALKEEVSAMNSDPSRFRSLVLN